MLTIRSHCSSYWWRSQWFTSYQESKYWCSYGFRFRCCI